MNCLYHYGSNIRCLNIIKDRAIRLSDIRKSNDYQELELFFPEIFSEIVYQYKLNPFPLKYEGLKNIDALYSLIDVTESMISSNLTDGSFSNLVICFSESSDLLSQWRAYSANGMGLSLGFSYELLTQLCNNSENTLVLEKVHYISEIEKKEIIGKYASKILAELKGLRRWIVDNMTRDDSASDTDGLLGFNFYVIIETLMVESLKYKNEGFKEEKEWRLFFLGRIHKNPEWLTGPVKEWMGPSIEGNIVSRLRNRIQFYISDDNISPYYEISFSDIEKNNVGSHFLKEIWLGPKSKITKSDLELFLVQNGCINVEIKKSKTSYR